MPMTWKRFVLCMHIQGVSKIRGDEFTRGNKRETLNVP